ncbi:MAG TPA: DinB family protein [Chitinophagaceae bacterium]|nr:DinB family protein [Chitinophagaceae bacterium]
MKYVHTKSLLCGVIALTFLFSNRAMAQATLDANAVKAQLIKEWQRSKAYTDAYLNTMPEDKYGFKAVDSIRSFAQQMLHLASGNFFLINKATGDQSPIAGMVTEQRESAQSKDSVMYYVNASYDFAIDAITKMDAAKLGEVIPGFNGDISRLTWLMKAIEHQAHHRGQTTIYIRLQGIRPPNEQLF